MQTWTANQLVAHNLRQARELRGWTQEQAAERLADHLGETWSVATFSAAERSVRGERVRQFSADELIALARGFDLPVAYFLTPHPEHPIQINDKAQMLTPPQMLDTAYGTLQGQRATAQRVGDFFDSTEDELTDSQRAAFTTFNEVLAYGMVQEIQRAEHWIDSLRALPELADALENVLKRYPRSRKES